MNNSQNILKNFFHEVSLNICPFYSSYSEILLNAISENNVDRDTVKKYALAIQDLTELLSINMSIVNLEINPGFFDLERTRQINIAEIFTKAKNIYKRKSKLKNKRLSFYIHGSRNPFIETFPIIRLIPFIIFDNCLKYSPSDDIVDIELSEMQTGCKITINSIGPALDKTEINRITEDGFRGKNAHNTRVEGNGIGLYYLEKIINRIQSKVTFNSDTSTFKKNDIDYSNFMIILELKNISE